MFRKSSNGITFFGLLSFLLVSGFGLSHSFGMEMRDDGTMGGCMFDGLAEICPMTLTEHISNWQSMVSVIPQKSAFLTQLFALVFILILATFIFERHSLLSLFSYFSERWKLYLTNNPHLALFNPIKEAFSQGILHPKIFDETVL